MYSQYEGDKFYWHIFDCVDRVSVFGVFFCFGVAWKKVKNIAQLNRIEMRANNAESGSKSSVRQGQKKNIDTKYCHIH